MHPVRKAEKFKARSGRRLMCGSQFVRPQCPSGHQVEYVDHNNMTSHKANPHEASGWHSGDRVPLTPWFALSLVVLMMYSYPPFKLYQLLCDFAIGVSESPIPLDRLFEIGLLVSFWVCLDILKTSVVCLPLYFLVRKCGSQWDAAFMRFAIILPAISLVAGLFGPLIISCTLRHNH